MEGMYGTSKNDILSFDFFAPFPALKAPFIKYCKAFEKRLRQSVPFYRVIPVKEDLPTNLAVAGFITEWQSSKGKNALNPITLELQFLEHHNTQFLDLHRDLMRIDYTSQSESALTNLKTLLLLEISLLLGCDVEWAPPSANTGTDGGETATSADGASTGTVLTTSGKDDDDESSDTAGADGSADVAADAAADTAADAAAAPAAPALPRPGSTRTARSATGAAGVPAAPAAPVLDVNDFTTWAPDTWSLVDFDKISFPQDPNVSICTVRSYMAIGMIFWYEPELRTAQPRVWNELNTSWTNTFHSDLHPHVLETWPEKGPHAFNESQSKWLFETLRYLKKNPGRPALRRRVPHQLLPAIAKLTPIVWSADKPEGGGGNTKKRRTDEPVKSTPRLDA